MAQTTKNKSAAIMRAASGIGLACAKILIEEGAQVVLIDRAEEKLNALCAELGENAEPLVIDPATSS